MFEKLVDIIVNYVEVNKEDIKGQAKRLEDIFFEITEQPAQEFSGEGEV